VSRHWPIVTAGQGGDQPADDEADEKSHQSKLKRKHARIEIDSTI